MANYLVKYTFCKIHKEGRVALKSGDANISADGSIEEVRAASNRIAQLIEEDLKVNYYSGVFDIRIESITHQ